ncbi:MAG: hypothetical protein ABJC13_02525 [Acidobacteriota bacterium]
MPTEGTDVPGREPLTPKQPDERWVVPVTHRSELRTLLKQSWLTYRQQFPVILAVVVAVWVPLECLSSYMDAFVFGGDDIRKSWKFAKFLYDFFGIIATAGVIFIGQEALAGQRATFRSALAAGFSSWGRMWWTRLLYQLTIVVGLLLLIVPGLYLMVRLSLVEPVAVQERISGSAAMRRSFELTEGRFWLVIRLGLALLFLFILPTVLIVATAFVPGLDHWLIDAAIQVIADVAVAFAAIALVTTYSHFNNEKLTA